MKKRRFPRISPTMARRVVMVMFIMALGIPLTGCTVLMLWMNEGAQADGIGDVNMQCSYCYSTVNVSDKSKHGDGICNKKEEEPPKEEQQEQQTQQEQPKEEQLMIQVQPIATCPGCKDTVAATTAHLAPCGDHYTCAGGYSAEDHADCSCGEPYCDGHVHVSTSKPRCPSCNEKVSAKNAHLADCQTHYACAADFGEAGNHNAFDDCGVHYICLGTDACSNKCACGVSYMCQAADHQHAVLPCGGHYQDTASSAIYAVGGTDSTNVPQNADDHEKLACETHYACTATDTAAHDKCGCGKYECDGTDHTGHVALGCGKHFLVDYVYSIETGSTLGNEDPATNHIAFCTTCNTCVPDGHTCPAPTPAP